MFNSYLVYFSPFWYVGPRKIWQPCRFEADSRILKQVSNQSVLTVGQKKIGERAERHFLNFHFRRKTAAQTFGLNGKIQKKKRKQGSSPKKSAFLIIFCAQVSASETLVTPLTHLKYESTVDK
jgi:hypothetical protein